MELPKEEATRLFDYASKLFEEQNYAEALKVLEQLHEYRSNSRRVTYARAECLYRLGRIDGAMELCDELINEHDYEYARKLRAKLETHQLSSMQNQEAGPFPATFASLDMDMDFDLPPTRIGPPPPLPGAAGAGGDSSAITEYLKITGALLFMGIMAGVLTLFILSADIGFDVSAPLAFAFVFSQIIAYPIGLMVAVIAFNKLPKETWLENFSYIAVVCAMLALVYTFTTFAYLFVPPLIAEFGGLLCLNIVIASTLRFNFFNLIVFLIITGIIRLALAFALIGSQLASMVG
jgi:hypothetical protein